MEANIVTPQKPNLYVDADACPVLREAVRLGTARHLPVVLVGNDTQNLQRFADSAGISVIEVPGGRDSADFAIATDVASCDIVITDDIGLACMVLGRNAKAVSSRGYQYDPKKIDLDLHLRHVGQKARRSGRRTKGPASFTHDDRRRFVAVLKELLKSLSNQ